MERRIICSNSRLDDYLLPKAIVSMVERAAGAEALFEEKERAQITSTPSATRS